MSAQFPLGTKSSAVGPRTWWQGHPSGPADINLNSQITSPGPGKAGWSLCGPLGLSRVTQTQIPSLPLSSHMFLRTGVAGSRQPEVPTPSFSWPHLRCLSLKQPELPGQIPHLPRTLEGTDSLARVGPSAPNRACLAPRMTTHGPIPQELTGWL